MLLETIINDSEYQSVRQLYIQWCGFMEKEVEFILKESELHTQLHCSRVLLLALKLGEEIGVKQRDLDILGQAAAFHDSRRWDDGLDKGHGKRAADYYKSYCAENDLSFSPEVYYIAAFHDQDDEEGIEAIGKSEGSNENCLLLYRIFKDADALDRFRLGPKGLDVRFLRTKEARGYVDMARDLLARSEPQSAAKMKNAT